MSNARQLTLTDDALNTIQDALAALRGLYEVQINFARRDTGDKYWENKLFAVEEAAQSIENQTGIVLPVSLSKPPAVAPY